MNGPQHYSASEKLLTAALTVAGDMPIEDVQATVEMAQVHATLALAAATAMNGIDRMDEDDFREWDKVAGVQLDGG